MRASNFIFQVISWVILVIPELTFAQRQTKRQTTSSKVDPAYYISFIAKRRDLALYYHRKDVLLIASSGRSGSTLLSQIASKYAPRYKILKSHILPPDRRYCGKIIFIFSSPDKAAESVLHLSLVNVLFGKEHFNNLESSDLQWYEKIKSTDQQTLDNNLLCYDALGYYKQLSQWLVSHTEAVNSESADILAIKYENFWDPETQAEVKKFLGIDAFVLPQKIERGYSENQLTEKEFAIRRAYNLGTFNEPRYAAYDAARAIWQQAPAFQYRKISSKKS